MPEQYFCLEIRHFVFLFSVQYVFVLPWFRFNSINQLILWNRSHKSILLQPFLKFLEYCYANVSINWLIMNFTTTFHNRITFKMSFSCSPHFYYNKTENMKRLFNLFLSIFNAISAYVTVIHIGTIGFIHGKKMKRNQTLVVMPYDDSNHEHASIRICIRTRILQHKMYIFF